MRIVEGRSTRPFLVLGVGLVCQISAGIPYWWPALAPGLQSALSLSDAGTTALVVMANTGSLLGILGGIFHDRFGSRKTAVAGSVGISLCFLTLALLVSFPLPPAIERFTLEICLIVTLAMVTFTYTLYSSCMTAAVTVFGKRYRGRVVGLSASMFGASAGVFGSLQAALFPSITQTRQLLIFFSGFSFVPALLAAATFPDCERYAVENPSSSVGGYMAIHSAEAGVDTSRESFTRTDSHISSRLGVGYCIAWVLVAALQASALSEAFEVSSVLQWSCTVLVVISFTSFFLLPMQSPLVVHEQQMQDEVYSESEPPFSVVARDWRYIYLCAGFFAIVGGGGIAVLVQAPHLVASRMYEGATVALTEWDPEAISRLVRSFVVIFSACNLMARLAIGGIMDWGENALERHMWKFDIMLGNTLVIACALLGIAFARFWTLFVAVAIVGLCHGTWFSSTPALATLWFGSRTFPRNYALVGPFAAIGSATLASTIPSFLRTKFGEWIMLRVRGGHADDLKKVCSGLMCSIPAFCLLAGIQFMMYVLGRLLRPQVRREAERCGY